jgi:biotin carboxylase
MYIMNRNRSVLMIGGGIQEVEAVRQMKADGWFVGVTDRNEHCACKDVADYLIVADGRDPERIIQQLLLNTRAVTPPSVVCTLTELTMTAAIVAHALFLPAPSLQSVAVSQSKALSKKYWMEAGVSTPLGFPVSKNMSLTGILHKISCPLVVKPEVSFGGKGITLVRSQKELQDAVRLAIESSANETCVIEEFVDGTLHDGNAFFSADGVFHPLSISDRFTGCSIAVESGAVCPSQLSEVAQLQFFKLFENACRVIGLTYGPVKIDALFDGNDFFVLEVAARLHGPRGTLHMIPTSYGTPLLTSVIEAMRSMEGPLNWDAGKSKRVCLYESIRTETEGTVVAFAGVRETERLDGIVYIQLLKKMGDLVRLPKDSSDVLGFVFAAGSHIDECRQAISAAKNTLTARLM